MSEQQVEPRSVEIDVQPGVGIVEFVHDLGGPVDVVAYTHDGTRVGYLMANPITDDEVEVVLVPDVPYARLVATLVVEEDAA